MSLFSVASTSYNKIFQTQASVPVSALPWLGTPPLSFQLKLLITSYMTYFIQK